MKSIGKASSWAKLLYEFTGTAFMVYGFNTRSMPIVYFIFWIVAYKVSGAHFNPAISLGVLIVEMQANNLVGFAFTVLAQVLGAYLGCGISYLTVKYYYNNSYLLMPTQPLTLYFSEIGDVYWGRPIIQEILQTFVLVLVYLVLRYDASMAKIDRVLKGICMLFVLSALVVMTRNSGGSLNPAIGLA
jgi:glycerol uptake facilitator-like aquaporin